MFPLSDSKVKFYLNIAKEVSKASKCLRSHFGVVIVNNDMIIGTGYNGPARGVAHCNPCRRADCPSGVGYEKCNAVHAEVNAIIQSGGRKGCLGGILFISSHNKPFDGTIYNKGMGNFPCDNCARLVVNAGIQYVVQEEIDTWKCYDIPELVSVGKIW